MKGKIYGIGYYDDGNGNTKIDRTLPSYRAWSGMLERCYSPVFLRRRPTYRGCTVCQEWQNLYKFNLWYEKNYYTISGQRMDLDKDILVKGNRIYSPETCVFVPQEINVLIIKADSIRGDLPIGVSYDASNKGYVAHMSCRGKVVYLKKCKFPEEAFFYYKKNKEKYIKQIADEYKDVIPEELYEALYRWKVEITD